MKNLTTALQKGNLKPKDRVLLIVQNQVKLETTGKAILSDAEIHALDQGWQPKDNFEVKEYNRYLKGWRTAGFAELDAQTAYLNTALVFQQEKLTSFQLSVYPFYRKAKVCLKRLNEITPVTIEEALAVAQKQKDTKLRQGEDFDYAVYELAFESLSKGLQKDLATLYEEVEYETDYLDAEEALAEILKGKDKPTDKGKDKIADLIIKQCYNRHVKEYQFYHYFASIPIREIAKRWLKEKGFKPLTPEEITDEKEKSVMASVAKEREISEKEVLEGVFAENLVSKLETYAKENKTTVEAELKQTILKWLDSGLLEEYQPIFISKSYDGYNGKTKLPHDQLFREWLKAKTKAREALSKLVKEERLVLKNRTGKESRAEVWSSNATKSDPKGRVITGESLYNLKSNYQFIKDFKERVDRYDPNLGIVYADNDPENKGQHLDRELLICDKTEKGKASNLSVFKLATHGIKNFLDIVGWIKETQVKGETILEFESDKIKEFTKKTTKELVSGYATLLAFRDIFNRLSKTYKIDLTYKINKWITEVEGFIDYHNEEIERATEANKKLYSSKGEKLKLKDDLFINKNKVTPNKERVGDYLKEFGETLEGDF